MSDNATPNKPSPGGLQRVDHLVLATPDLDTGVDFIRDKLGIEPVAGGHHPVYGTRNALVSLGDACYLEIVGPDNAVLDTDAVKVFGIHALTTTKLVTWAATSTDLEDIVERARREMIDLGSVTLGSRRQADGRELTWNFTDPLAARHGGVIPFFIDWGATEHPAGSLPAACTLRSLTLHHPHANEVERRLNVIGLEFTVETAGEPRVAATIESPNGSVEL